MDVNVLVQDPLCERHALGDMPLSLLGLQVIAELGLLDSTKRESLQESEAEGLEVKDHRRRG